MSDQSIQLNLFGATSLPVSADGSTHCSLPAGPQAEKSGPEAVPASHSVKPAKGKARKTTDTCGPIFFGSSPSADLQQSLENKLRLLMDVDGSPEYIISRKCEECNGGLGLPEVDGMLHCTC